MQTASINPGTQQALTATTPAGGGVVVTIQNSLSISVDIYDVFNPGSETNPTPFVYTKLGTINAGATGTVTTIRAASMLQAMYTGAIAELNNNYYYQFPVKIMSGTQFSFGDPPPLSYTIVDADRLSMIQSFKFHKFAMANPSSALTGNLNTAIKTGNATTINAFFSATKNFSNCTLGSWNAVMTWLEMFTSGWQGPYFLYETAPNPLPTGYTPNLVATLNIVSDANNNTATLNLCTADSNGNPIFATPPSPISVVMVGDGTMSDSDPGNDSVSIALTPVWMNVIQTSMQGGTPVTNYIVGSTLTGTVAGTKVVSSQTARQIPGQPEDKKKASSFDSSFGNLCQAAGLLASLLMVYEFVSKKYAESQKAKEEAKEKAANEEDLNNQDAEIDSQVESEVSAEVDSNESSMASDASDVASNYSDASVAMQRDVMSESMNDQAEALNNEISEQIENAGTPSPEFESAVESMENSFTEAKASIESGNFSEASQTISEASSAMEAVVQQEASQLQQSEADALSESSSALDEASSASDALDKAQTEYDENLQDEDNDSGYDGEDESDPTVDDIPPVE